MQAAPRRVALVAGVIAVLSLVVAAHGLGFKTDRTDLVDPTAAYYADWAKYEKEFGGESDIIFIIEGTKRSEIVRAIKTLARDLESFPQAFQNVCYRIDLSRLHAKGLYQLPIEDLEAIDSRVKPLTPLLAGGWRFLTLDSALGAALAASSTAIDKQQSLDESGRQKAAAATRLLQSMTSYLYNGRAFRSPWVPLRSPTLGASVAGMPEYFFSEDGKTAIVRAEPIKDTSSLSDFGKSVDLAKRMIDRMEPVFPDLHFGLTGLPVLEADEMISAKRDSTRAMLISLLGVGCLFMVAFRAWRHPMCAILTLIISACWTLGWVTLTVGHLNILSASFIVTLVGLGIDFGILWLSRFESMRGLGLSVAESNRGAATTVGPGVLIGGLTTALAFFTTMATGFLGLREMGWIAGSGVLWCLVGAFTVLPALLVLTKGRVRRCERELVADQPAALFLARRPALVGLLSLLVVIGLATQITKLRFDYNLLNLQSDGLASVEWEEKLVERMGASAWYALSMAETPEEARRLGEEFAALPSVGRVVEVASLIPTDQEKKRPYVAAISKAVADLPTTEQVKKLPPPELAKLTERIEAIAQLPKNVPVSELVAITRLRHAAEETLEAMRRLPLLDQDRRVASFQTRWLEDLFGQLRKLHDVANPEPVGVADLPSALRSRYLSPDGTWLLQIFADASVWDGEPLNAFVREVYSVDPHVTGKPISTLLSLREMTAGYQRSAWLAIGVILLAVWCGVRSWRDSLLAMTPLVLGCLAMFGLMGIASISLNPANMIALPLILGIGVDFGVHVVHDFHASNGTYVLGRGLGRALVLTSLTTILGFASLMTASHRGMSSIGVVLSLGVACCSLAALVLLPALLQLLSRTRVETAVLSFPHGDSSSTSSPSETEAVEAA
ncbi:MMPL family transporter [Kolteria novifilia]|uniref:MMPL family transporter n=1 Tax=Kolteria novifilia TaxID=2527975 RepID=UPI003AF39EB5